MKHIFCKTLLAVAAALVCSACEQKELLERHDVESEVAVRFDWNNAPSAAPKKMVLYLYPDTGGKAERYEFDNANGGRITVPVGTYDAVCFNGDTERILLRNPSVLNSFEAYTDNVRTIGGLNVDAAVVPRAEGTERERMTEQADLLWRGRAKEKLVLTPRMEGSKELVMQMMPAYEAYNITVRYTDSSIEGMDAKFGASLSSLAPSLMLASGAYGTEAVTVPAALAFDTAQKALVGRIVAFGNCDKAARKHFLMVYAILPDGRKYGFKYDVSAMIHSAPDKQNVQLRIDDFYLPNPIGGLKPSVREWQIIDVPIAL